MNSIDHQWAKKILVRARNLTERPIAAPGFEEKTTKISNALNFFNIPNAALEEYLSDGRYRDPVMWRDLIYQPLHSVRRPETPRSPAAAYFASLTDLPHLQPFRMGQSS